MPVAAPSETGGVTQANTSGSGTPNLQTQVSNASWAATVLGALGPTYVTQNNIQNMLAWMASEEPPSNWANNNNPLNINAGGTGSDMLVSLTQAAQRSAQVISQSNMAGIKAALANNAPYDSFRAAVVASPWASGHYNNGASFASPNQPIVGSNATALGNVAPVGSSTTAQAGTCGAGSKGININPVSSIPLIGSLSPQVTIFNACQVKAITGGLMVSLGAVVGVVGLILVVAGVAAGTKIGQQAAGVATTVIPQGRIAGAVGAVGRSSTASKAISGAQAGGQKRAAARQDSADEELYQETRRQAAKDRENPSPARRQFQSEARAARTYGPPRAERRQTRTRV